MRPGNFGPDGPANLVPLSALVACLHFNCGSHAIVNRLVMTRHLVNDAEDVQATERTALLRIYNLIRQGTY